MSNGTADRPARFWQFFLSESVIVVSFFAIYDWMLVRYFCVNVISAFAAASIATGVAVAAFLVLAKFLAARHRHAGLLMVLFASYGVAWHFAPRDTAAGATQFFRSTNLVNFVEEYGKSHGHLNLKRAGGGFRGTTSQPGAMQGESHVQFNLNFFATEAVFDECTAALKSDISQRLQEARLAEVSDKNLYGKREFLIKYAGSRVRGGFAFFSSKIREDLWQWYGYYYEYNTLD